MTRAETDTFTLTAPCAGPTKRPCVLQINQTGAWRTALDFDATELPDEFLEHADKLLRLAGCGERSSMRVVMARQGDNGRMVATNVAVMRWTRQEGWVHTWA